MIKYTFLYKKVYLECSIKMDIFKFFRRSK